MSQYKKTYSKEEVEEITIWFEERLSKLPKELQINAATMSTDLPHTVGSLIYNARHNHENVVFSALIGQLNEIRELLIKQGID